MLCLVGDCGNIVIFAIFAKFAIMLSFLPFLLLRAFLDISLFVKTVAFQFAQGGSRNERHEHIDVAFFKAN